MNDKTLLEKYNALVVENETLKKENERLRAKLRDILPSQSDDTTFPAPLNDYIQPSVLPTEIPPSEKIKLFATLFRGRDDIYAKRWENKKGDAGYSPACRNEWKSGVCRKPQVKCSVCAHRAYDELTEQVIEDHLRGKVIVGLYPLCMDETCRFLAMDFDDKGWQGDVTTLRSVCLAFDIPVVVERSRSGNGAHTWFFFENPISAHLARKFGSALITCSMSRHHDLSFKSYDRLFPNQDTLPKGGFGNLIALPLQKKARELGNSAFIDENFDPYENQWEFLSAIQKMSEESIVSLTARLSGPDELGALKKDDEEIGKSWEPKRRNGLTAQDFPKEMVFVRANMIFIPKAGISQKGLNAMKRLAAFKNPDFYKAQAMRLTTYNKPRIISCCDETPDYLCLPRGCEGDITALCNDAGIIPAWLDKTQKGRSIQVDFNGILRDEQCQAIDELLKHENGVLSATTAFGKTVIAAKLIAERKVNTLVLVHRQQLLTQWMDRLGEFLKIGEALPVMEKKRGRQKRQNVIGLIGAGKKSPGGIVDIAIMQSLGGGGDVLELVKDYGMVIVDECHHVPAFSFEKILKTIKAKYVYGLTATAARQDGHHPIIFMHRGPIRYRVDAKQQAHLRPFEHYIIPRFTNFRLSFEMDEKDYSIQELYSEIVSNDWRNRLITDDVIKSYSEGRNGLVLTERTVHVEVLAKMLQGSIPDVISLTGSASAKEKKAAFIRINETPAGQPLTLLATGKYIGEGFDEPRLDTLFLAMPISWKGTVQQYAGRLHRLFAGKENVQIYDYVDSQVRVLSKMYNKRLAGYASLGYKVRAEGLADNSVDIIFDHQNFQPVYENDLAIARKEIVIVSPFATKRRIQQASPLIAAALHKQIKVVVVTRPVTDYKDDKTLREMFAAMESTGLQMVFRSNIHQKFAIIDQSIVWYGSVNLLGYGRSEETMMRLESANIAGELMKSLG
ncbi:MAG: DEAD/DEAH box helicase family protein [Smithellaceae bacterium]